MNTQTLWVPFAVLNASEHTASARLVWILLSGQTSGNPSALTNTRLQELSGLDRNTIARIRSRLAHAPLGPCYSKPRPTCAAMPVALLTTADVSAPARLLYGQLQGVPDFAHLGGSFTFAALSRLTGTDIGALRPAVSELVATGWLTTTQANRKSPICFTLRNAVAPQLWARIAHIRRRVKGAQYRGEALLREFLNIQVALDHYEDNAAPDILLNPYTGELMELDRYYPSAAVAFEFQGDQHFEETDLATFEETVKQVGRDAMKAFICKARGIELVIICPEDLSMKAIDRKIPERLPRRELEGLEPLVAALEELASAYRERSAEGRARKGHRRPAGQSGTMGL